VALFHYQNRYMLGGNHATWWIIKALTDAGWTVPFSGSGTGGLYATSNVFDMSQSPKQNSLKDANGVGVGSEPWGHGYCWIVLQTPTGGRQWIIRRHGTNADGNDDDWHVGFSHAGRFGEGQVAGTDWDADTQPLSPDNVNLLGSPPTSTGILFRPGGTQSLAHVVADSTPSPEGEYGFFFAEFQSGNLPFSVFFADDLRNAAVGDPLPLTFGLRNSDSGVLNYNNLGQNWQMKSVYDPGGAGETLASVGYQWGEYNSAKIPSAMGMGIDGKIRAVAPPVGFRGGFGYMGLSRWLRWLPFSMDYPTTASGQKDVVINWVFVKDLMDGTEYPGSI